jgi:hypothetical protein
MAVMGASGLSAMHPRVARDAFFTDFRSGLLHAIAAYLNLSHLRPVARLQRVQDKLLRLVLGVPELPSVVLEVILGAPRIREVAFKARVDVVAGALRSPPGSLLRSLLREDARRGLSSPLRRHRSDWWAPTLQMLHTLDADLADLADSVVQDTVGPGRRVGGAWASAVKSRCDAARLEARNTALSDLSSVTEMAPFLHRVPVGCVAPFLSVLRDAACYWRSCAPGGVRAVVRALVYLDLHRGCLRDGWCPRCGAGGGWTLAHAVLDCVPVGDAARLPGVRAVCLRGLQDHWPEVGFSLDDEASRGSVLAAVLLRTGLGPWVHRP